LTIIRVVTFGQLRTFLAVAETGSIRGAAAALYVSEPSVSSAVAALSRELGVPLTERVGRGIRLTDAGRELASYAARILGLADRAARAVREATGRPGHLRLGAVTTAGESIVPRLVATFLARGPRTELSLEVGNRAATLARLLADEVDLAIAGRPPAEAGIHGEPFAPNLLVVVAPPRHPLAARRGFPPTLLSGETWLLREPGSGTRENALGFLAANGVEPGRVMSLGSNGAIVRAIGLGLGVSLLSLDAVTEELASGELVRLRVRGTPLRRAWHVLTREDAPLPPSAAAFLELLRTRRRGIPPSA
jgi:DNA-binding transcriptional LysR family regulator